ncbi:hypothetical protein CU039_0367 [Enterococcus faecium]|nr:hypothetical protein [Enterococcus faecium]MBK4808260.1 hypothetical protein [Enterococcus faecium]
MLNKRFNCFLDELSHLHDELRCFPVFVFLDNMIVFMDDSC